MLTAVVRATGIGALAGGAVHQVVAAATGSELSSWGVLLGGVAAVVSAVTGLVIALRRPDPNRVFEEGMRAERERTRRRRRKQDTDGD